MNQHSESSFTTRFTPTALRTIAGVTSATSAIAAYPVAADLFGMVAGGVVVASSAAAIYAGWHYVGTETDTSDTGIMKRIGAGVIASVFAVAMVAGIHASANLQAGTQATTAAADSDRLYEQQEQARMSALGLVTAELRATSKSKYPGEYANLQKQVDKLSVPTPRQATASQITQATFETSPAYRWGVASVFEVVTPALLVLAGMFARRKRVIAEVANPATPVVDTPATAQTTPLTPENNPVTLLASREIQPNNEGFITASVVMASTGCTDGQARAAIKTAHQQGYLTKTGEGGATRYSYPKTATLRAIK